MAPPKARDMLVEAAKRTSLKLIIEKPFNTKLRRMITGIKKPRVIGSKQIKKQMLIL